MGDFAVSFWDFGSILGLLRRKGFRVTVGFGVGLGVIWVGLLFFGQGLGSTSKVLVLPF